MFSYFNSTHTKSPSAATHVSPRCSHRSVVNASACCPSVLVRFHVQLFQFHTHKVPFGSNPRVTSMQSSQCRERERVLSVCLSAVSCSVISIPHTQSPLRQQPTCHLDAVIAVS